MSRCRILAALLAVVIAALGWGRPALAQAPDIRNIRPLVMLMVDSSGSMERLGDCVCTTSTCEECLPQCGGGTFERNRWSTVVEAMTGTFDTFTCTPRDRSMYTGEYDHNYYIPHFELPISTSTQSNNGILDVYQDRVRFGMMTFDGIGTLSTTNALVPTASWTSAFIGQSEGPGGMFSYGGPKPFNFPGCLTDYMIDNGARGERPPGGVGGIYEPGNLVSVGNEATDDHTVINQRIQDSLLSTRPFGPTPIAGMFDDLRYYLDNHPHVTPVATAGGVGDPFAACRDRYALLITDGYPNADMRDDPYNCDTPGFICPFERPEEIAADLCQYSPGLGVCQGDLDGVFVVGFNISDTAAVTRLNDIAAVGGTTAALFADDRASLMTALSAALDRAAPGTTTRTVPAFTSGGSTSSANGQFQFNSGFRIAVDPGEPWLGVLERRRFECNGTTVEERPIESRDRFHETLVTAAASGARRLYTALPSDPANSEGFLTGTGASTIPGSLVPPTAPITAVETNLSVVAFNSTNVTRQYLGVASDAARDDVINWVLANSSAPAARRASPLGDVYHSSPTVVSTPTVDLPDESYNLFREQVEVSSRPTVVYVGSNDGVLHAFATADHTFERSDGSTVTISEGEELWGFIPPALVPKLEDASQSHQWMVDGPPVIRDMFIVRRPGDTPVADQYRTILVIGLRGGDNSYFALDVTNPVDPPVFLWQFTHTGMGEAFGRAGMAQVVVDFGGGTGLHERAVAIVPGGEGRATGAVGGCTATGDALPAVTSGTSGRRTARGCYTTEGRQLHVVDVVTGRVLRSFDHTLLTAPLNGGVSVFTGDVGTVATRAYTTDADGVIWRLDLSSPDRDDWELVAFHDLFWDGTWNAGQPGENPPVLSTDNEGRVIVVQATGDIDLLDSTAANRVASLTENVTFDGSGALTGVTATLNWEIPLDPGEQVTGPLELFDSRVYFGTFRSEVSALDACDFGFSRLWGVHYINRDAGGGTLPEPGLESPVGSGTFVRSIGPLANEILMGVAVTQRPNCFEGVEEVSTDAYLGSRYRVTGHGGGTFQLVAQVGGGGTVTAGGSVGEIVRDLPTPSSFTRVQGWTASVD